MTGGIRRSGVELALQVVRGRAIAIGPVQAILLEEIRDNGSIAAAQRRLGASYSHVWKLVAAMNAMFSSPLVEPVRGGSKGGGARLTHEGRTVLDAFRRLEAILWVHGDADIRVIGQAAREAGLIRLESERAPGARDGRGRESGCLNSTRQEM